MAIGEFKVIVCDKCKAHRVIKPRQSFTAETKGWARLCVYEEPIPGITSNGWRALGEYDLCPECWEKLKSELETED